MNDGDELAEAYRLQAEAMMTKEAERRVLEAHDPAKLDRLRSLSLLKLVKSNHPDLIPALMSRLGPVRAALDGHGGGLLVLMPFPLSSIWTVVAFLVVPHLVL